jgi:hypothetical protein
MPGLSPTSGLSANGVVYAYDSAGTPVGLVLAASTNINFTPAASGLFFGSYVANAVVTSGTKTVTSATAAFTSADIGKIVAISDPLTGANFFAGTIATINSATSVTLTAAANAPASWSNGYMLWGFDNYARLTTLLTAAALQTTLPAAVGSNNGVLNLPGGIFMVSQGVVIPDGVAVRGAQNCAGTYITPSSIGTVICAGGAVSFPTTFVVQLGVGTVASTQMVAKMERLAVNGMNFVANNVLARGWAAQIMFCRAWGAATASVLCDGNVQKILYNDIVQQNKGYSLDLLNAKDILVQGNEIHGAAGASAGNPTACLRIRATTVVGDLQIFDNHFWVESPIDVNRPAQLISMTGTAALLLYTNISRNIFDTPYGHAISMVPDASSTFLGITIDNNQYILNDVSFPDATFDFVNVTTVGGSTVLALKIANNFGSNLNGNANSWINAYNPVGAGAFSQILVSNNQMRNCAKVVPVSTAVDCGNTNNSVVTKAGVKLLSSNRGRSTQSGNGATTVFNIAHLLSDTPQTWSVVPRVALAAPNFIVTADATNLIVTYATAPPSVASNVDLTWSAEQ